MPILTQQSDTTSTPGRVPVTTGVNGVYTTRDRVLSGTLVARDALSPVYEGDRWLVSSGASSGTLWEYVNGAWSFVPVGATASDIVTALGAVPETRTVAGAALTGNISAGTLATALGVGTPPAVTSVSFTNTGSPRQFRINSEVRVGGVLVPCAIVNVAVTYPTNGTSQFGLNAGIQINNFSAYYGAGVRSYMHAFADLSGLMRIEFTGNTTNQTIYVDAWSSTPESPHVYTSHTVP